MEVEINQTCGKKKKPRECRSGGSGQVQCAEAWAPPKSAGEAQQHVIATQKNELLQFRKRPLDCG
jgi:hypothetical protein